MNDQKNISPSEDLEIDLRVYFKILKKRRVLITLVTLLSFMASGILSFFVLPPVYEAKALLLVAQATDKPQQIAGQQNDLNSIVNNLSRIPVLTMNTYVGQAKSEVLMQRVIDKLQLEEQNYDISSLAKQIEVTAAKDSNLLEVTVSNTDPRLAADIANTLSQEFLLLISEKNQEQMERSVNFMQGQQGMTEKDLEKATEDLKQFNSEPRSVEYLQQELAARSQDLNKFRSDLTQAQVEMQQLTAAKSSLEESLEETSRIIKVQVYDQAQGKMAASEEINPVYTDLAQKLNDKKAALAEKQAQVNGLLGVMADMSGEIDQIQAELVAKKTAQDKIQSDVQRLENTSNLLAEKTTQTQIARSIDLGSTNLMVVSPATAPNNPVKPRKMLNMAAALVIGLLISIMLAFLLEFLDNTIKSTDDVAQHLDLPVLGSIPTADLRAGK